MTTIPQIVDKVIFDGVDGVEYQNSFWEDLKVTIGDFFLTGGASPSAISYKSTYIYIVGYGEFLFFSMQVPHRYKEGTNLYAHIHWTPHSYGVEESGSTVNWRLDLSITNINGVIANASTYVLTDTCDGVNDKHQKTDDIVVSGSGLTISSMLTGAVYRAEGDTWDAGKGNEPGFLELDFHYEIDRPGSRYVSAK